MTNKEIQNKVKEFKKCFGVVECDYQQLKKITEKQGYTLVEFNHIFNDEAVATIVETLNLTNIIVQSKGFTYVDNNYRLVFIHEDLSENEKLLLLAHENAHIFLKHMSKATIIGTDVQEEFEANEFSHYLLHKSAKTKFLDVVAKHKTALLCLIIAVVLVVSGAVVFSLYKQQEVYYGDYYITETGHKYHKQNCIFVKDKNNVRRLTQEEFDKGEYQPCQTCLP